MQNEEQKNENETQEVMEQLSEPFPEDLIKTRIGRGKIYLSYVEGHNYIKRLNEIFGLNWSFRILEQKIFENEVVVLGELTVNNNIVRQSYGNKDIAVGRSNGLPVSIGDDLKAAQTDALKKACSTLGIGLHLYGDKKGKDDNFEKEFSGQEMTDRQKNAIVAMSRSLNIIGEDKINEGLKKKYGKMLNQLSKKEASEIIGNLKKKCESDY